MCASVFLSACKFVQLYCIQAYPKDIRVPQPVSLHKLTWSAASFAYGYSQTDAHLEALHGCLRPAPAELSPQVQTVGGSWRLEDHGGSWMDGSWMDHGGSWRIMEDHGWRTIALRSRQLEDHALHLHQL
eukprot:scaffold36565_cov25-Tisochrysis_lutea.AAC.1